LGRPSGIPRCLRAWSASVVRCEIKSRSISAAIANVLPRIASDAIQRCITFRCDRMIGARGIVRRQSGKLADVSNESDIAVNARLGVLAYSLSSNLRETAGSGNIYLRLA
jgi:hypothetical protein